MTTKPHNQLIIPFLLHHWFWFAILVVLIIAYIAFEIKYIKYHKNAISNAQLTQLINSNSVSLLDIRPEEFFDKGHITGSSNLDIMKIIKENAQVDLPKDKPLVLITGLEADCLKALPFLNKQGYTDIKFLAHGVQGWKKEKLPFATTDKKVMKKKAKVKTKEKAKNGKS